MTKGFFCLCVSVLMASCGGGGVAGGPPEPVDYELLSEIPWLVRDMSEDEGVNDVEIEERSDVGFEGEKDTGMMCPGGLFCPCESNSDCFSRFCVETMEGYRCTNACVDEGDCPRGWRCVACGSAGSDHQYCCVPPFQRLCRPCRSDMDCIPSVGAMDKKYLCIMFGGEIGRFCGVSCDSELQCPSGFTCREIEGNEKQCYPDDGICPCPDHYKQFITDCYISNAYGTCYGTRHCDSECDAKIPAPEACNTEDDDCDGVADEEGAEGCEFYYYDNDNDGYGVGRDGKCLCAATGAYRSKRGDDCDDERATVNPGALELCGNGIDDDCDGLTDEAGCQGCIVYYKDSDNDGYGVSTEVLCLGTPQGEYRAVVAGDCDDDDSQVYPGAVERCNTKDDNCNGQTDEEGAQGCIPYFFDSDQDGWGISLAKCLCGPDTQSRFTAPVAGDCNDQDATVNPSVQETCNNKDDNCNGQVDEERQGEECGTGGYSIYYLDTDSDGYGVTGFTKCLCNAEGNFRATTGGDCDDTDSSINPGAPERCSGKDDNCNGETDEEGAKGCSMYFYDYDGDGWGIALSKCLCAPDSLTRFTALFSGDCNDNDVMVYPSAIEICNSSDDDCDGQVDEERITLPCDTDGYKIFYYDGDNDGYGRTQEAKCLCTALGNYKATQPHDCDDNDAQVNPEAIEGCNGKDDNCNGETDEENSQGCIEFFFDADNDTYGITGESKCLCAPYGAYVATRGGDCNDVDGSINPGAVEKCNNEDDNCDGFTDEERSQGECGSDGYNTYFYDFDGDGFGRAFSRCFCGPLGYFTALIAGDCDDNDASVNPSAIERCDGKDNNCAEGTDEGCDDDGDEWCDASMGVVNHPPICPKGGGDCDDDDPDINPEKIEVCQNGKDDDCNGVTDIEDPVCSTVLVLVRNLASVDPEEQKVISFLQQNGYQYVVADSTTVLTIPVSSYPVIYFRTAQEPVNYNNPSILQAIRAAVEGGSSLVVEYHGCHLARYLGWASVSTSGWWPVVYDTLAYVRPITTHPVFAGVPTWDPPTRPDRPEQTISGLQRTGSYSCVGISPDQSWTGIYYWVLIMTYGWPHQNTNSEYCRQWGGCTGERSVHQGGFFYYVYRGSGKVIYVPHGVGGVSCNAPMPLGPAGVALMRNLINWIIGL